MFLYVLIFFSLPRVSILVAIIRSELAITCERTVQTGGQ